MSKVGLRDYSSDKLEIVVLIDASTVDWTSSILGVTEAENDVFAQVAPVIKENIINNLFTEGCWTNIRVKLAYADDLVSMLNGDSLLIDSSLYNTHNFNFNTYFFRKRLNSKWKYIWRLSKSVKPGIYESV